MKTLQNRLMSLRLLLPLVLAAGTCSAAVVSLDFEGIAPHPHSNSSIFVQNYYNGGQSSNGSVGPDYGVTFNAPALLICLNTLDESCSNTSRGGQGSPESQLGALFFLTNSAITMDVDGGFDTGFSFNYVAISNPGSVQVFSGPNGTGSLLTTLALPTTPSGPCPGYSAGFCPFFPVGVSFSGTAQSVVFAGVGNQIVFDDITFGSAIPGPDPVVPEPGTIGLVTASLGVLFQVSRRRARKV
jgi:hypothetical protein